MMARSTAWVLAFTLLLVAPPAADARLVKLVIEQREAFAGGAAWGPPVPTNGWSAPDISRSIRAIRSTPSSSIWTRLREARGRVEFRTPFFILKPVEMARGNGKIYLHGQQPRKRRAAQRATVAAGRAERFALRLGYTIVDAGWQGDLVPRRRGWRRTCRSPAAGRQPHRRADPRRVLGSKYPARRRLHAEPQGKRRRSGRTKRPTNRARHVHCPGRGLGAARAIAPDRWAFGRCPNGRESLPPPAFDICYFDGFRCRQDLRADLRRPRTRS